MGTSAAARARAPGCGCSRSSARVLSPCRSRGTDTPLPSTLSRRDVNALRGHGDNEADSQAVGRGEAAGWEGVLPPARRPATPALRPQWETFLHCPQRSSPRESQILPGVPGTGGRVGGEWCFERRSGRGHVPGALVPSGQGIGVQCSGTRRARPWPSPCADDRATGRGWSGDAAPPRVPAGDLGGGGGRRSRGQGRGQRAALPPGERPLCHSPIVRCISDCAGLCCPGREKGRCPPGRGCLLGAGRVGGGRGPGMGLGAHFRTSPLREALPYLSHRRPPRTVPAF